ncbi:uncharacterized protein LOC117185857 [Drosophila miranda]|uniref:uncharacterized protein LOC117185857 n=1 Tax=Drosophila miranda TaxID=7229 RepID=UPI00143F9F60|nr:uncharacterized protein LOC117185857 [Drosophila miranda]
MWRSLAASKHTQRRRTPAKSSKIRVALALRETDDIHMYLYVCHTGFQTGAVLVLIRCLLQCHAVQTIRYHYWEADLQWPTLTGVTVHRGGTATKWTSRRSFPSQPFCCRVFTRGMCPSRIYPMMWTWTVISNSIRTSISTRTLEVRPHRRSPAAHRGEALTT